MRHWKTIPLIAFASLAFATQAKADVSMTAIIRDHNLSALEAAAAIVIADALNLDADFVVSTSRNYGTRPSILGPVWIMSRESHRPLPQVWRSYRKGKGWGNVAKECGMHPSDFNKLRVKGNYGIDEYIWMNCAHDRYGWNANQWTSFRRSGYTPNQIIYASVAERGNYSRAKESAKKKSWNNYKPSQSKTSGAYEKREAIQGPSRAKQTPPATNKRRATASSKSKQSPPATSKNRSSNTAKSNSSKGQATAKSKGNSAQKSKGNSGAKKSSSNKGKGKGRG
ncbi:MAG: hypothetical protein KF824_05175 [Fimbriimonadaceae bacterium]|nr:MAG: hypothetical protein KF824_05175 [Fimbriimonadaceae bacterium]